MNIGAMRNCKTPIVPLVGLLLFSLTASAGPSRIPKRHLRGATFSRLLDRARMTRSPIPMNRFLKLAAAEKDPLLYKFALGSALTKKVPMTRAQKKKFRRLVSDPGRGLLPRQPLIPRKGKIEVRYFIGSEFFDKEVKE